MKKLIYLIALLPVYGLAQFPVTDAAANAQLIKINLQLVTMNSSLTAINGQLTSLNTTMQSINALMSQNVAAVTNTSALSTAESVSQRTAPSFLWVSPEMTQLLDLKNNILDAYNATMNNVKTLQYLEDEEISEATDYLANMVVQVAALVTQATTVAASPEAIEPGLRLSTISRIVEKLDNVMLDITRFNDNLNIKNTSRQTMENLIKMN